MTAAASWVVAVRDIFDGGILVARKGHLGRVIAVYFEDTPMVSWERTGRKLECELGEQIAPLLN
jgi:hypothetical protein